MNLQELHRRVHLLESYGKGLGWDCQARAYIHFYGSPLEVTISVTEKGGGKDAYNTSKDFGLPNIEDEPALINLFAEANDWIANLPTGSDLAMVKLRKIIDSLPTPVADAAAAIWDNIRQLLINEAERLSKNVLPRKAPAEVQSKSNTDDFPF